MSRVPDMAIGKYDKNIVKFLKISCEAQEIHCMLFVEFVCAFSCLKAGDDARVFFDLIKYRILYLFFFENGFQIVECSG